jgi:hypothetical protein
MALENDNKKIITPSVVTEAEIAKARVGGRLDSLRQSMPYTGKEGLAQSMLDLNKKGLNKVYLGDSMEGLTKKIAFQQAAEAKQKADNQGVIGELVGFATQAVVGEIILGTVDGFAQLLDIPKWMDMLAGNTPDFDNWLSSWVQDATESVREFAPIHVDPTKKGWNQMTDTAWWFSNGVSVASTVSLMIPAAGVARAAGWIAKAARASAVARATARPAGAMAKALNAGNKIADTVPALSKFSREVAPLVLQAGVSRLTESSMEAAEVFRNRYDYYINEKGLPEEKAREYASKGAAATFNADMGLMLMDIAQYVSFARTFKAAKLNLDSKVGKLTNFEKVIKYPYKAIMGSATMVGEGFEEFYQYAQQEEGKKMADYYAGLSDKKGELGLTNLGEYTEDGEAWTSALFGALGGKAFEKIMPYIQKGIARYSGETFVSPEEARLMESMEHTSRISKGLKQINAGLKANNPHAVRQAQVDMGVDMAIKAASQGNWNIAKRRIEALKNNNQEKLLEMDPIMQEIGEIDTAVIDEVLEIGNKVAKSYETMGNSGKYHVNTIESIVRREILADTNNKNAKAHLENFTSKKQEIASNLNLSLEESDNLNTLLDHVAIEKAIKTMQTIMDGRSTARTAAEAKLNTKIDDKTSERLQDAIAKLRQKQAELPKADVVTNIQKIKGKAFDEAVFEGASQHLSEAYKVINNLEINDLTDADFQREYTANYEKGKKEYAEKKKNDKKKKKEEDLENQATGNPIVNEEEEVEDNPENLSDDDLNAQENEDGVIEDPEAGNENITSDFDSISEEEGDNLASKTGQVKPDESTSTTHEKKTENTKEPETVNESEEDFARYRANVESEQEIAQVVGLLAWRSFNNLKGKVKEQTSDRNKALTSFIENSGINLADGNYSVTIDVNYDFINSSEFKKWEISSEVRAYLENPTEENGNKLIKQGNKEFPLFSLIPMKATIVASTGAIVNYQDFNMELSIHEPAFFFTQDGNPRGEMGETQYLELLKVKNEAIKASLQGKAVSYPINTHSRGKFNNKIEGGKFAELNVSDSLGIAIDDLQFVYGVETGSTGTFLNADGSANPSLLKFGGARKGGIYTIIEDNFGKPVPARLSASNLTRGQGKVLFEAYKELLKSNKAGEQTLSTKLKNLITNSPDASVNGISEFLNLEKTKLNELVDLFLYQGTKTKGKKGITIYVERGNIVFDDMAYKAADFANSEDVFLDYIETRLQQIKPTLLSNKKYKEYLVTNNIVTTNLAKTATGGFFVQPVIGYNTEAKTIVEKTEGSNILSVEDVNSTIMSKFGVSQDIVNKMTAKDKEALMKATPEQAVSIIDEYKPTEVKETVEEVTEKVTTITSNNKAEGTNARGTTYIGETTEKDGLKVTKYSEFRSDGRRISKGGRIMTSAEFIKEYGVTDQDYLDNLEDATEIRIYEVREGENSTGISILATFPEGNAEMDILGAGLAALKETEEVTPQSDIEAKKADIEKRRQEELKPYDERDARSLEAITPNNPNHPTIKVGMKKSNGLNVRVEKTNTDNWNGEGEGYTVVTAVKEPAEFDSEGKMTKSAKVEEAVFNSKEEADEAIQATFEKVKAKVGQKQKGINAKYDAELKALEETSQPQTTDNELETNKRKADISKEIEKLENETSTVKEPDFKGEVQYFRMPDSNGNFKDVNVGKSFEPVMTMVKITVDKNNSNKGTIEYVGDSKMSKLISNNPNTYLGMFSEYADSTDNISLSNPEIKNLKKGIVEKTSDGWKVIQKPVIVFGEVTQEIKNKYSSTKVDNSAKIQELKQELEKLEDSEKNITKPFESNAQEKFKRADVKSSNDATALVVTQELADLGKEMDDNNINWKIGNIREDVSGRLVVDVVLPDGRTFLMYKSTGEGSGVESKGEWVPLPGFAENGWFVKTGFNPETGQSFSGSEASSEKFNPKFNKYGSTKFKEIADYLKENEALVFSEESQQQETINPIGTEAAPSINVGIEEIKKEWKEIARDKVEEIINKGEENIRKGPITEEDRKPLPKEHFNKLFSKISNVINGIDKIENEKVNKLLKQYLKEVHPDKFKDESKKEIAGIFATAMISVGKKGDFTKLNELYNQYKELNNEYQGKIKALEQELALMTKLNVGNAASEALVNKAVKLGFSKEQVEAMSVEQRDLIRTATSKADVKDLLASFEMGIENLDLKIFTSGLKGGFRPSETNSNEENFDPRTESSKNADTPFAKNITSNGKTYRVVGVKIDKPSWELKADTEGRDGMAYASVVDDGNLPVNIDEILIEKAIEEGKTLYSNLKLSDSNFVKPDIVKKEIQQQEVPNTITTLATDMMNRLGVQFEIVDELDITEDAQLAKENIEDSNINFIENIENVVTKALKEKIFRIGKVPFEKTELEDVNIYVKKENENNFSIAIDNKGRNIFGLLSAVLDFQRGNLNTNAIYAPNPKGFILWETFLNSDVAKQPKAKVIVENRFSIALGALKALKNNGIEFIHFPENLYQNFIDEYSKFLKIEFSSVGSSDSMSKEALKTIEISIEDLIRVIDLKNTQKQEITLKADKTVLSLQELFANKEYAKLFKEAGITNKEDIVKLSVTEKGELLKKICK